jgi:hypothetical protein
LGFCAAFARFDKQYQADISARVDHRAVAGDRRSRTCRQADVRDQPGRLRQTPQSQAVFLTMGDGGTLAKVTAVWIALAIFIFAALYCLFRGEVEYHQTKVERVFDLAKEYRTTLQQTNAQFSDRWNAYESDAVDPYNGGNIDEQAYDDLVNRFLSQDANRDSFQALAGFYDSVGECVQAGLCDFWFARTTFGNDIVTFYHNMYPVLEVENQQGHGGAGILDFVDRMHKADRNELRRDWRDRAIEWTGY